MQTIGERLEEARKRKGVSIREAAEATKIRGDYLHKFENNQFDIKLPEIYVRGFLRTYAVFLKLPSEKLISDYKGLGLAEPRSRSLSRENFGRMEISVASAKPPGREAPPPAAAESGTPATPADGNPATFRPRAGASPQIDRALIIKAAVALAGLVLVIALAVWGFRALSGGDGTSAGGAAKASSGVLVPPVPGEPVITVHALAPVSVSLRLTAGDGQTLFSGRLQAGETRVVPHRGTVRVEADPPSAVELEIGGRRYPMPARMADVEPPRSAANPAR